MLNLRKELLYEKLKKKKKVEHYCLGFFISAFSMSKVIKKYDHVSTWCFHILFCFVMLSQQITTTTTIETTTMTMPSSKMEKLFLDPL